MLTRFERGLIAHLIADWVFQNDWMATHKSKLYHPAAWIHAAIHIALLGLALGMRGGITLGILHLLIDTRVPLRWWQRLFRQTMEGPTALHTSIWLDQVLHLACLALWVALGRFLTPSTRYQPEMRRKSLHGYQRANRGVAPGQSLYRGTGPRTDPDGNPSGRKASPDGVHDL